MAILRAGTRKHGRESQTQMATIANRLAFEFLDKHSRAYLNLNSIITNDEVCELSADGLHWRLWVVQLQGRLLLQQVCSGA